LGGHPPLGTGLRLAESYPPPSASSVANRWHMSWSRLFAVIRKEFIHLLRDRRTLGFVLLAPVMELLLFGYAGNTDVDHLPAIVYDESRTAASRAFAAAFQNSGYFDLQPWAGTRNQALQAIDEGSARVVLVIPPDFGDKLAKGETATVQIVVDGSNPNVAQAALSAGGLIAQDQSAKALGGDTGQGSQNGGRPGIDLRPLVLYNPTLNSAIFIVPGLVGMFVPFQAMLLTALAVVRERERGTLEQLVVTPITSLELMIGKVLPNVLLAFVSMALSLIVARLLFGVGVAGSLLLLLLLTIPFVLGSMGIGLLISVASRTQPQAQQMAQVFILPSFFVSGVLFPRESLPLVLQIVGDLFPTTYFLEIIRGIMLKGVGLTALWPQAMGLTVFSFGMLALAVNRFRKRID